jgi:hypothetical protein
MSQERTEPNETLLREILIALGWNKINMATALIETDRMSTKQLKELEQFLWDHNGEITEEEFLAIAHK